MRDDELYHFGILGMKWGVRRYQNEDGSWTDRGKSRRRSNEPHKHKRLTKEQKEKLKKIGKAAAIGAGVAGAAVGGYFLARKVGPKAMAGAKNLYTTKFRGPDMDYATAVKTKAMNDDLIEGLMRMKQGSSKGSQVNTLASNAIKSTKAKNRKLTETIFRTGFQNLGAKVTHYPTRLARYHVSPEGAKYRKENLAATYKKLAGIGTGIGGAAVSGGMAYAGAAAMDKLFDESRDRRIARKSGSKYVKRPMNARAADYMFPKPH